MVKTWVIGPFGSQCLKVGILPNVSFFTDLSHSAAGGHEGGREGHGRPGGVAVATRGRGGCRELRGATEGSEGPLGAMGGLGGPYGASGGRGGLWEAVGDRWGSRGAMRGLWGYGGP